MAKRKKENRPLRFKKSIYKRKGRAIQHAQELSRKKPAIKHWLLMARTLYFRQTDIGTMWRVTCQRLMPPPNI
jgi:1,2-phenylacetyl-CoA epoxidase PaaB subunit